MKRRGPALIVPARERAVRPRAQRRAPRRAHRYTARSCFFRCFSLHVHQAECVDLLIEARWLLPIAPANTVLADHAVALSGGRIVAVGPAAQLRARFVPRERLVRTRHALLPGLVNAHTSACHALLRGLPVRGPRRRWLAETLAPVGQRAASAPTSCATARGSASPRCCVRASPASRTSAATRGERARRRRCPHACRHRPAGDRPPSRGPTARPRTWRAPKRCGTSTAAIHASRFTSRRSRAGVSEATLMRVRRVADELDARIAVQLAELAAGRRGAAARYARWRRATQRRAPRAGGAAAAPGGSSGCCARDSVRSACSASAMRGELELLAHHGAAVIACPQAELRLGAVPGPLALPEGHRTGLGTDSPAAAGALDLLAEARLAALLSGWSAAQALRMATLGGATALGLAAEIGSIEPGKAADLTCIDLEESDAGQAARVADGDRVRRDAQPGERCVDGRARAP